MTTQNDDPFFSLGGSSLWNACIGRQAFDENYVDGYTDAALLLAETVIVNNILGSRDTIVFPILYNARHGVELTLKYLIKRLREAGVFSAEPQVNHNIRSHWTFLTGQALGDETLRLELARLELFIQSLANIDDDGQSFRYSTLRGGQAAMDDHSLANIEVIRDSLRDLRAILERLKFRLWDIEKERRTGTYTTECSRLDLKTIAHLMPDRNNWDSQDFTDAKSAIMKRFGLGSRGFSRALDKIQTARELKLLIGVPSTLAHLSDEHVELVIEQWCRLHPNREPRPDDLGLDYFSRSYEDMKNDAASTQEVMRSLLENLSNDEVADVDTIFYIGRDKQFSEHYEDMLAANKREHEVANDRWVSLSHVVSKTNFAKEFANGLDRVGRPDLAAKVSEISAPT